MTELEHADLELEVAAAAAAEARLSQERTQAWLRRVAGVTALVLVILSAATLAYVVVAVNRSAEVAQGNRELLAAFQADQEQRREDAVAEEEAAQQRLREALEALQRSRQESDDRITAQLQLVLDLLVAEVRRADERGTRAEAQADEPHRRHGRATPAPSPSPGQRPSPRPSQQPSPTPAPSPSPSCANPPVLGLCVPPPSGR